EDLDKVWFNYGIRIQNNKFIATHLNGSIYSAHQRRLYASVPSVLNDQVCPGKFRHCLHSSIIHQDDLHTVQVGAAKPIKAPPNIAGTGVKSYNQTCHLT